MAQICDISSDRPPERDVVEESESNSAAKIPMYGLPALLRRQTYVCNLHADQVALANRPGGEVTGRVSPMWRFLCCRLRVRGFITRAVRVDRSPLRAAIHDDHGPIGRSQPLRPQAHPIA